MAAAASASQKQYEEFEPSTEIVQEQDCDTILLHVPGFTKEKLRVQLTTTKVLSVSGEREIENNKWIRFQKQFPFSSNYDTNKITAKFEKGILYIRQPKLITPEDKQDNKLPVPEPPTPQKPADKPQYNKQDNKLPVPEPPTPQKPADKPQYNKQDNKLPVPEPPAPQKPADKPQSSKPAAAAEPQPQTNVQQKPAEKTSPRDDGPSKKTDVHDVPQKKLDKEEQKVKDEKSNESKDSTSLGKKIQEAKTSSTSDKPEDDAAKAADKKDKGTSENVGGSGKTIMDSYKGTAVDLAAELKRSRRLMNVVLVALLAVVLGLYIANFIRSFRKTDEN